MANSQVRTDPTNPSRLLDAYEDVDTVRILHVFNHLKMDQQISKKDQKKIQDALESRDRLSLVIQVHKDCSSERSNLHPASLDTLVAIDTNARDNNNANANAHTDTNTSTKIHTNAKY